MRRIVASLSIISLLVNSSCGEKEIKPFITFPSSYHKTRIDRKTDIKVFISSGEITNKSIVNKFAGTDTSTFRYLDGLVFFPYHFMDSVDFSDSHNGVVHRDFKKKINCTLGLDDGLFILTQKDVEPVCCYYGDVFTRSLEYNVISVKPEVTYEYILSSTRGFYTFGYQGKQKYIFTMRNDLLVAPITKYVIHNANASLDKSMNNILKPDFYKNLQKGDTLVYNVSYLEYEINK